jgi:hypothetical protein
VEPDSTPPQPPAKRPGRYRPQRGKDPFGEKRSIGYGANRFKIESLLTPEHLRDYYALIRQPRTTYAEAHQWLHGHGYTTVGMTAVRSHMKRFRGRLDTVQESAEMSYACAELARQTGTQFLADGAVARFETLLSQALFDLKEGGKLGREQWDMLGRALTTAVGNRAKLEELRSTVGGDRPKSADEPTDGPTVVERVKEILGV